jgi:hypothetical protein
VNTLVLAAGTFIGGLVLGGLGPKAQVRTLEQEAFELQRQCADASGVSRDIAGLLTRGLEQTASLGDVRREPEGSSSAAEMGNTDADVVEAGNSPPLKRSDEDEQGGPDEEFAQDEAEDPLEAARDVMEIRAAQARAALFEDIEPNDEQVQALDELFVRMNDDLITIAYDVVEQVRADGEPDRLSMMRTGVDTLDVLIRTEEELLGSLTSDQIEQLGEGVTDPSAFVDPTVVDVLQELSALEQP